MKKRSASQSGTHDAAKLPGFREALGEAEMKEFLSFLQSEYDTTPDKAQFFEKYHFYFNCYAYASGGMSDSYAPRDDGMFYPTMAVPGAAAGRPMRLATAQELDRAVVADGYERALPADAAPFLSPDARDRWNAKIADELRPGKTLVAAFVNVANPTVEAYHFAVRDDRKEWSQKFGRWSATSLDADGEPIRPPHQGLNCFQHPETFEGQPGEWTFVGYYWRPEAGLRTASDYDFPMVGLTSEQGRTREDVWMNTQGVVGAAEEVHGWSLQKLPDGRFKLGVTNAAGTTSYVDLPESFTRITEDGGHAIAISDPSGPTIEITMSPGGNVTGTEIPNPHTARPSPFSR